jgi:hypothetical protein
MTDVYYPGGIDITGDEVYVICLCGKRIYWMKRDLCSFRKHYLPEGWSRLSPCFDGQILCPECGKAWDRNHADIAQGQSN